MKLCEKCGTPQKDENFRCVECGEILGKPLSDKEKEIIEDQISDYIDNHADRTDPFYISRLDKVMVALDIIGAVASALVMIFRSPLSETDALCLLTAFIFVLMAIDTAFPQIQWFFEKLRVELHYHVEHLEPSDLYLISRKIMIVVIPIFTYLMLIYVLLNPVSAPSGVVYEAAEGAIVYYG